MVLAFLIPVGVAQVFYGDGSLVFEPRTRVVSVRLADGKLHVEKREASNVCYPEGGGPLDSVWKDIYCASNGAVVLERTVKGTVVPAQTTPERVEWPDDESRKVEGPRPWTDVNWTNVACSNSVLSITGKVESLSSRIATNLCATESLYIAGLRFLFGTDDVMRIEVDKDCKMDQAASNLVSEVGRIPREGK